MYHKVAQNLLINLFYLYCVCGNGVIRPNSWLALASFVPILFRMGMIRTGMFRPYITIYITLRKQEM